MTQISSGVEETLEPDLGAPFQTSELQAAAAEQETAAAEGRPIAQHILSVVEELAAAKKGLGYDLGGVFLEELAYDTATFHPTKPPMTMCVGAVTEILIRATNKWAQTTSDTRPYKELAATMWTSSRTNALRIWLFQIAGKKAIPEYGRAYGAGARDAFVLFGIGESVSFEEVLPGDVIYFNRTSGSGHAAIFLGYLGADFSELSTYSEEVRGFKYFSSQGSGVAGLDYRYAYFDPYCPDRQLGLSQGKRRDCGVIRSNKPSYLSAARLHSPDSWRAFDAPIFIERFYNGETIEQLEKDRYATVRSGVDTNRVLQLSQDYSEELPAVPAINYDGLTSD